VQVDPIKPTFKAPGTKLLVELQNDEQLSSLAFNLNLRRYMMDLRAAAAAHGCVMMAAGAYTRPLLSST